MDAKYQKLTVRFPRELLEGLRPLAEQESRSLNGEIVQAVREYLARKQKGVHLEKGIQVSPLSEQRD